MGFKEGTLSMFLFVFGWKNWETGHVTAQLLPLKARRGVDGSESLNHDRDEGAQDVYGLYDKLDYPHHYGSVRRTQLAPLPPGNPTHEVSTSMITH